MRHRKLPEMAVHKAVMFLLMVSAFSGCARQWPHEGRGGLAERDRPCDLAIRQAVEAVGYLKKDPGLRPPSKVNAAEERLIRASRESRAGLYEDAARSYDDALQLLGSHGDNVRRPRPFCYLNNNRVVR